MRHCGAFRDTFLTKSVQRQILTLRLHALS